MKTLAAVLYENKRKLIIENLTMQKPKEHEVLVKVKAAGLCHSDWNFVTGDSSYNLPVVLGHEGAGIVIETGKKVSKLKVDDRVLFNSGPNCGECFNCLNNHPSLCDTYSKANWNGVMFDGTTRLKNAKGEKIYQLASVGCFAEYLVLPETCCVQIYPKTPYEIGAIIGCAVTTGIGAVLNTSNFRSGSNAIVFGVGGVGANVILGLKLSGANKVFAIDANKRKKEVALQLGATEFIEYEDSNISYINNIKTSHRIEFVYDATGKVETQQLAIECLSPGGVAIFIGIPPVKSKTNFNSSVLIRQEKTIKGSYYGTSNTESDLKNYERLYNSGHLDLDSLVSHKYKLEDINSGYKNLLKGDHIRGIIHFE